MERDPRHSAIFAVKHPGSSLCGAGTVARPPSCYPADEVTDRTVMRGGRDLGRAGLGRQGRRRVWAGRMRSGLSPIAPWFAS